MRCRDDSGLTALTSHPSNTSDGAEPAALLLPISARFADISLEREFAAQFVPELLAPFTRRSLGFGALTFAMYGPHDLLVLPEPVVGVIGTRKFAYDV